MPEPPRSTKLTLPPFDLDQRKRFKLLVVLSGNGRGVEAVDAKRLLHNGGRLVRDLGGNGPSRRTMIYALVVAVLVGAAVVGVFQTRTSPATPCVSGKLTVVGSTAFMPVVDEIATDYEHACSGATITAGWPNWRPTGAPTNWPSTTARHSRAPTPT